ncbi:hypothetical protein EDB80DRAFT_449830 [Ilyonectria destructans]|nr:hypothetical protein EDB80DRAFT_449830 [Ilyonectria destructans]
MALTPTFFRILRIGKSSSTVMAGSVAFAISCIQQGPRVDDRFYWTLYAFWAFLVICVITFTSLSVIPNSLAEYFCLLVVMETVCLAIVVAASGPTEILKRLQTWGPGITVLCVNTPTLAVDSRTPGPDSTLVNGDIEARGNDDIEARGNDDEDGNSAAGNGRD